MSTGSQGRRVILDKEFDDHVTELMQFAMEAGRSMSRTSASEEVSSSSPEIQQQLEDQLRVALEDEIVPAHEIHLGGIDQGEVEREIVKKALVGLKMATLKKIARDRGAPVGGTLEALATRIAGIYEWDQREVARLILANEDEPSIERGHVSRLFPLESRYDVDEVHERLETVVGRYIRIGVARWFLFQEMLGVKDRGVEVHGTFKTYQATVDGIQEVAALSALPQDSTVGILLNDSAVLQVNDSSVAPAKAAVLAFGIISGTAAKGYLPLAEADAKPISNTLHASSEFLLDIVHNRLSKTELTDINLTVARFRLRENDQSLSVSERRPELKAVRFEGEHLLDSVSACRLLAIEGRALVELAFQATVRDENDSARGRFPVRITAEKDHVAVQTGLGAGEHELSRQVHRSVIKSVSEALEFGADNTQRLESLFDRMKSRAESQEDPEVADILDESDD